MEGRSLLSCKWAVQIILSLTEGQKRPSELKRSVEGIKERVLFDRLSRLLKGGIVGKWSKEGYPKETYYYLKNPEDFRILAEWISSVDISVEEAVKVLSCKWTLRVMENLKEAKTPSELKRTLKGISDKVLQDRLSKLERLGLIRREVVPAKPVRVEYGLTDKGHRVLPSLLQLEGFILSR